MAEKAAFEQRPAENKRFKIPKEPDGFHYVICERPHPNDESASQLDLLDDMGYVEAGDISRRKVAMRIPMADFEELQKANQDRSRRNAMTPAAVTAGGQEVEGVMSNTIEDLPTVTAATFLGQKDSDGD
jgi:hypothetical protein